MNRPARLKCCTFAVAAAAAGLLISSPLAHAEPPTVPRAGQSCPQHLVNVPAFNSDQEPGTPYLWLECRREDDRKYVWTEAPPVFPVTRWLTLGSDHSGPLKSITFTLGDDPNLQVPSTWVGTPQDAEAQCISEQTAYSGPGFFGKETVTPQIAGTGSPLQVEVLMGQFQIEFKGYCLWTVVE